MDGDDEGEGHAIKHADVKYRSDWPTKSEDRRWYTIPDTRLCLLLTNPHATGGSRSRIVSNFIGLRASFKSGTMVDAKTNGRKCLSISDHSVPR